MSAWLVARVLTNVEENVTRRLLRYEVESYWPKFRESVRDRRSLRKRTVVRPLYPCYLFVKTFRFHFLFEVEGITGVVMSGAVPSTSFRLDAEIERMQSSEVEGYLPQPIVEEMPRLTVGSKVVILAGVLKGRVGTCREIHGSRVKVGTRLFGGETPVWHSERDLAAA